MCTFSGKKNPADNEKENIQPGDSGNSRGRLSQGSLSIVGIGPGSTDLLCVRAIRAIEESQVVIGYKSYLSYIDHLTLGKKLIPYPMKQEVKRAQASIDMALGGKKVCLVSSGDPGIYGMAGLVLELLKKEELENIRLQIIPGITSASACAALLGAPIMHDFTVISLSDLLTDRHLIERRIECAARGDFVIVFYNPRSKRRFYLLEKAQEILLKHKATDTVVGIVKNAERENEKTVITTLINMLNTESIDMNTTIIVGNSQTITDSQKITGRHFMITPRGYKIPEVSS